jgi:hypothetical protein
MTKGLRLPAASGILYGIAPHPASPTLHCLLPCTIRRESLQPPGLHLLRSQPRVLSRLICQRYLNGETLEKEWRYRTAKPMFSDGPPDLRPSLGQDWFQHGKSTRPFMPLEAMRSKGDGRDLELVVGAPHCPESMSFERF